MTVLPWLLGGLTMLLVAVHMTRPYASRAVISAARFFWPAAPPAANRRRWRLANPLRSRPLWLQLPASLLLLATLLTYNQSIAAAPQTQALGIWLLVDTSASMSAKVAGVTRFDLALAAVGRVISAASAAAQGERLCFRLSAFDQDVRHLTADADATMARTLAAALQPRGLGTDLSLVQKLSAIAGQQPGCPVTHMVVVSDLPAPQPMAATAVSEDEITPSAVASRSVPTSTLPLLWEGIELSMANSGITGIEATVDPLSHQVMEVAVEIAAYGPIPATQLQITPPGGAPFIVAPAWQAAGAQEQRWLYAVDRPTPGRVHFQLLTRDGLAYDNEAAIEVPIPQGINVDWRLEDTSLPNELGWQLAETEPVLRVVATDMLSQLPVDEVPLLLVGAGYGSPFPPAQIVEFADASPLLTNVSFEQLERAGLAPFTTLGKLPAGFTPVLAGGSQADSPVWLAEHQQPPAVYIPGLPSTPNLADETWRSSALLFGNAVRWLLRAQAALPLYTVTTPVAPEPEDTRLAIHPEESNTMRGSSGAADLGVLSPQAAPGQETPIWPWWVVIALAILGLERNLAAWKGRAWC